jgi:hypothetical protein
MCSLPLRYSVFKLTVTVWTVWELDSTECPQRQSEVWPTPDVKDPRLRLTA